MSLRPSRLPPLQRARRPERILRIGSALAVIAIMGIVVTLLVRERSSAELAAARSASNIVQLIDTDVQRNVEAYDVALKGIVEVAQNPALSNLPDNVRRRVLFDRSIITPYRGDLLWIDANGDVLADSVAPRTHRVNFANDPMFVRHRQDPDRGLMISAPFQDTLGNLGWCISFSRRISTPSGEFAGVASGALRLSYFDDLFNSLNIGEDSSVNLLNKDGIILARQPASPDVYAIGRDLSPLANFQRVLKEGIGSFTTLSEITHKQRQYVFSKVGELPLIVVAGLAPEVVYASWERTAIVVGTATGLLCLGILWLSLLLGRELRLRHSAEQDMATLAATDSLTGLANRRRLDLTLQNEWSRAVRNRQSLAVLMIDVDHFKAFNLQHGHQGGDLALQSVAATIEGCIRRPGDLAARYGGEEFLVVLPNTDVAGALALAEAVRQSVEAMPPFADASQPITVSIGVSALRVSDHNRLADLLGAADAALYSAKRNGRNQVVTAG